MPLLRTLFLVVLGAVAADPIPPEQPAPRARASATDSLAALRDAKVALQRFQRQFDFLVEGQRIMPSYGPHAVCSEPKGRICIDARNGDVPYGVNGSTPIFQRTSIVHVPRMDIGTTSQLQVNFLRDLDRAAAIIPGDEWIAGQRIRRFVDNGNLERAGDAARACRSTRWWCAALVGYIAHLNKDLARADSAYTVALAAMPVAQRCSWQDVSALLDRSERSWFKSFSCAARDSVVSRIWWLADPLFLLPGNERRTEHYSRWVYYLLEAEARVTLASNASGALGSRSASTTPNSDLLSLDVLQEVVLRMGIPGFSVPADVANEENGFAGLPGLPPQSGAANRIRQMQQRPSLLGTIQARVSVYQFMPPRFHFVPAIEAIQNPMRAEREDWALGNMNAEELYHPAYAVAFVPLDHQLAYFRRGDSALLVAAADIARDTSLIARGASNAALVLSHDERTPPTVWRTQTGPLFLWAVTVPQDTALIDLEVTTPGLYAARARYAAGPRPFPAQRVGVSDLLVLESAEEPLPTTLETALLSVAGGVRVASELSLGVFWETYGLRMGDSATFSVAAGRSEPRGVGTRLMRAVGIGNSSSDSTHVQWTEVVSVGGDRLGRSINLSLSQLAPGPYTLQVTVSVAGQTPVTAEQRIEIAPRIQ